MNIKNIITTSSLSLLLVACGGGSDSQEKTSNSYVGAGSRWDVTLTSSNNTFSIDYSPNSSGTPSTNYTGTYVTYPSNFLEMTETSTGNSAYALEVPGYALFVNPANTNNVISMISSGVCPISFNANWLNVKTAKDTSDPTKAFFGHATYSSPNNIQLQTQYNLTNLSSIPLNSSSSNLTSTCTNGEMTVTNTSGNTTKVYLSTAGGAIVHSEALSGGNGVDKITFATPTDTVNMADIAGTYSGFTYNNSNNTKSPVKIVCQTNGTCIANKIDVLTDVTIGNPQTITFTQFNQPSTGFISGTIASSPSNLVCTVDLDAGGSSKNVMSCITNDSGKLVNILLVER